MFELKIFSLGELATNAYLIVHPSLQQALLIDAPYPCGPIRRFIADEGLTLSSIILTHSHYDHIGGLNEFACPFYIHEYERDHLMDPKLNFSSYMGTPFAPERNPSILSTGAFMFASDELEVIHTPGHTPGSVSIKCGQWLFTGDTLFFDSVGRTDIPGGDHEKIIRSIKENLFLFEDDLTVYPGHGKPTTLEREKAQNPFVAVS